MIERVFKTQFQDRRTETIWLTVYADLMTNLALVFLALFGLTMMGDKALRDALLSMKLGEIKKLELSELEKLSIDLRAELKAIPEITVIEETGSARITFGENVLFESGKDALKVSAEPILMRVARTLDGVPFTIVVEGHTDNVPLIPGSRFKNNWELSLGRAMSVVELLRDNGKIASDQLAAAAYGSVRPRGSNETVEGKRINRRVEIALLKDFPYKSQSQETGS